MSLSYRFNVHLHMSMHHVTTEFIHPLLNPHRSHLLSVVALSFCTPCHHLSLSIYLPFLCFFCWNFLKWVWMVAAAFSTSTGLSGGMGGAAHVPLLALESEHNRTQRIAREAEAIAMEALSVAMIEFKHAVHMLHLIQAGYFSGYSVVFSQIRQLLISMQKNSQHVNELCNCVTYSSCTRLCCSSGGHQTVN